MVVVSSGSAKEQGERNQNTVKNTSWTVENLKTSNMSNGGMETQRKTNGAIK